MKIQIKLDTADVMLAISDYVKSKYPKCNVESVEVTMEKNTTGYGLGERTTVEFKGATVEITSI